MLITDGLEVHVFNCLDELVLQSVVKVGELGEFFGICDESAVDFGDLVLCRILSDLGHGSRVGWGGVWAIWDYPAVYDLRCN